MITFDTILSKTLSHEGTYSNRKSDRGGETYKGISRKYHPNWPGWKIIDDAKERIGGIEALKNGDVTPVLGAEAQEELEKLVRSFYKEKFWHRIKGDALTMIDDEIAFLVFDATVNPTDRTNGAKMLQEALNELGYKIAVDGIIGPVTLMALQGAVDELGRDRVREMFRKIRALHYAREVKRNPHQALFIEGWIKRALFSQSPFSRS